MRFRLTLIAIVGLCAATHAGAQEAAQNTRFEGTVRLVNGSNLIVTTGKGDVLITLTPHTRVLMRRGAEVGDIKQGSYLGTANQNASAANTGTAKEVHLLNDGPNTNSPMNDQGLTMTNGHVTSVTRTDKGQEIDIDYGQGTKRHVVVPDTTTVTALTDMSVADLKPGVTIGANTTKGADGKPAATFITIETSHTK